MYIRSRRCVAARIVAFELSPLNELCALNNSHTFGDILNTCISGQDGGSRARVAAPPCWPCELSHLNEFHRGKLVHSITLITLELS